MYKQRLKSKRWSFRKKAGNLFNVSTNAIKKVAVFNFWVAICIILYINLLYGRRESNGKDFDKRG
jgi:hypothetical protein